MACSISPIALNLVFSPLHLIEVIHAALELCRHGIALHEVGVPGGRMEFEDKLTVGQVGQFGAGRVDEVVPVSPASRESK